MHKWRISRNHLGLLISVQENVAYNPLLKMVWPIFGVLHMGLLLRQSGGTYVLPNSQCDQRCPRVFSAWLYMLEDLMHENPGIWLLDTYWSDVTKLPN